MSTVFPEEKGRFLVAGPFDSEMPHYYVMITDFSWWLANEEAIYQWMEQCLPRGKAHHQGMVVTVEDDLDLSSFLLRWS